MPDNTIFFNNHSWNPVTDTVSSPGEPDSTLSHFSENGSFEFIRVSGSGEILPYNQSKYNIYGADGYLKSGDYVVWLGRWVRICAGESIASSVKNANGQYNSKSGVSGLMSSTDKAYLTDLANHFVASNQKNAYNSGNDCYESGLYGHVNAGRPSGSELFNLICVKDKNNNTTSQLAIGQDSGQLWARGKVSGSWIKFLTEEFINASWGKRYMPVFHCKDSDDPKGWLVNWCRDTGIYIGGIQKDCGAHPPVLNGNHTSWVIVVYSGIKTENGASDYGHRMQIAYDTVNAAAYIRRGWVSSNEWAGWVKVGKIADGSITESMLSEDLKNKLNDLKLLGEATPTAIGALSDLNTVSKENIVGAVNEVKEDASTAVKVKGDIGRAWDVTSDDKTINGQHIMDCTLKPGWIFTVSENLSMDLRVNPNEDVYETLNLSKGDMVMALDSRCDYINAWRLLYDSGAKGRIALFEKTIKIRGSLGNVIVSDDPNYNEYAISVVPNIKPGDAFIVSADQSIWWGSTNPPKAGDMIISIGDNSSLKDNWIVLYGARSMTDFETRLAAIEQKLNDK